MRLWDKLRLVLWGCVYVEHRRESGWKGSLPFYYAVCPTHGPYENYPHGRGWVRCPECFYEVLVPQPEVFPMDKIRYAQPSKLMITELKMV